MEALTDELLARAAVGDQAALEGVYRSLAPQVQGYLLTRGATDPEGLTSDVFLQVLPMVPRIAGGVSGLRKLVFTVAHARLVDEFRRHGRGPRQGPYDPALDDRHEPSAEHHVLEGSAGHVRQVLERLGEDQRAVVTLRVLADLSVAATAEVLGKSEGAVKQLQRRGLAALREILAEGEVVR
ncbi:RNA polymerase sigma factor [Nocardioides donggukensis]|uniref:RNA polymerase sigma factor n=1 Tax=Nocardioides donggukensis TaxID=2774019 RepID=UPI00191E5086|nr:RNA polymerase sigma factor [Nocardioides donggukensis]